MFHSLRFPTQQQDFIWLKRRQKIRPSVLAKELNVSRPFISKAQRIAEGRILQLFHHTARVNRIKLKHISSRYGVAVGYCPSVQSKAYIIYSPNLGIQTWYTHKGNCRDCESKAICKQTLEQLSVEWMISLPQNQSISENALVLFKKIEERLGWI
ncbi:MAG: hypothetical protein ACFFBX_09775 [Promethearchaeota archaeon]